MRLFLKKSISFRLSSFRQSRCMIWYFSQINCPRILMQYPNNFKNISLSQRLKFMIHDWSFFRPVHKSHFHYVTLLIILLLGQYISVEFPCVPSVKYPNKTETVTGATILQEKVEVWTEQLAASPQGITALEATHNR